MPDKKRITISLDPELYDQLERAADERLMPPASLASRLVALALPMLPPVGELGEG